MTKTLKISSFIDCVLHGGGGGGWGVGGGQVVQRIFFGGFLIMFGTEKRGNGKKFLNAKS